MQIACDSAKAGAALPEDDAPSHADDEPSFAELQARIANTLTFLLQTLAPRRSIAAGTHHDLKRRDKKPFRGQAILIMLPNFYFHLTAAYAILRHWQRGHW